MSAVYTNEYMRLLPEWIQAEGPNSIHWKNVKLEVLSCCTKFHEPHVV